jgi:uncharacterized RDD family membrane protein YckC
VSQFEVLPPYRGTGEGRGGDEEDAHRYASWGIRVAAYLIDGLVLAVVAFLLAEAFGLHHVFNVANKAHSGHRLGLRGGDVIGWLLIDDALIFAYATWLLASKWHATLGMRLVSIHLANEDGSSPTLGRTAGRTGIVIAAALLLLAFPPMLLAILVDLLWPIWDSRNQTLHDKLIHTVVMTGRTG